MKTKIVTVLLSLMLGGITLNAQDHKGHQNSSPAKTENSSEKKDQATAACCQEMKDMKSCQGMDQHKKTAEKTAQLKEANNEAALMFTCSMHPEVKSAKPGKCPKCGMDLAKQK